MKNGKSGRMGKCTTTRDDTAFFCRLAPAGCTKFCVQDFLDVKDGVAYTLPEKVNSA